MDVAQRERRILDRARGDVRHRVLVAHDFDRRLQADQLELAAVARQRAAHLEIGANQEDRER